MIDEAVARLTVGARHLFEESRDYDVLLPSGRRLAPKAVFGIALGELLGRGAEPADFSAGWGQPSFDIIEAAGYPIVAKDASWAEMPADVDDERVWAEGSLSSVTHLRRERASGLADAKKRQFIRDHGALFCERCGLVPSRVFGAVGDACIEVHHRSVAISKMDGLTPTRLVDLQCLCANCHRMVHRE